MNNNAVDILASFEVNDPALSLASATRMLTNIANNASIEDFHPSMTNTLAPVAKPICADRVDENSVGITLAIPHTCFKENSITSLLNTIHSVLIGSPARLTDIQIPQNVLSHFSTTENDIKTLCNQLKQSETPYVASTDPTKKSAYIFDVIQGGKGEIDGKVVQH